MNAQTLRVRWLLFKIDVCVLDKYYVSQRCLNFRASSHVYT